MRSGRISGYQKTVLPQAGQKWKAICLPLSPIRSKVCDGPEISAALRSKKTATPKAEPVRFLHASQWQSDIRRGWASRRTRRAPQAQEAECFVTAAASFQ